MNRAQSRPLLSRVAESVYWMARYIERAENVARFAGVNLHLILDLPGERANQWQALVEASGDAHVFEERYGEATPDNVTRFLTFDRENPNSIVSCLAAARENARSVRDTISSEMWEQANSMYLRVTHGSGTGRADSLADFFSEVRMACHLFHGITDGTMSHNEAWHFMRVGRKLERADKTTRILDVKYFLLLPSLKEIGTPYDDLQCSSPSVDSRCTGSGSDRSRRRALWSFCLWTAISPARCAFASAAPTSLSMRSRARHRAGFPARASSGSACCVPNWITRAPTPSWPAACTNSSTASRRE
jgi:A predicted alpha-helical domain with a conserved ER motif.